MADALFIAVAVLTIGAAIVALESRELVYGAIALAISMLGIAGFFLLLEAPFVAMFQITVYVGPSTFFKKGGSGKKSRGDHTTADFHWRHRFYTLSVGTCQPGVYEI